jgi:hypothetical protein
MKVNCRYSQIQSRQLVDIQNSKSTVYVEITENGGLVDFENVENVEIVTRFERDLITLVLFQR